MWSERYDNKCDIFSVGVLLYVLLCLYCPFDGDNDNDILRKVMRCKFNFPEEEWKGISNEAKDLLKKLLFKWPKRRPTAEEALQHSWFSVLNEGQERNGALGENDDTGNAPKSNNPTQGKKWNESDA